MKPRLGFLGVGWIGRHRLEAVARAGVAEIAAIADPSPECREAAAALAPAATACEHLGQLLELPLDGIVIATPSALHAEQSIAALERGRAVFCQKPLGRSAAEVARVVETARREDLLLGVDLSYRHTEVMRRIQPIVAAGGIGRVFAADLVFHNAYGPDKPWFYDRAAAGGGCVMDLGIHLVDLALWVLGFPAVRSIDARVFAGGEPLATAGAVCEDFASVHLTVASGAAIRIACSWKLSAGRDCAIEASFYGTDGAVSMRNVGGSFFDFVAERWTGTRAEPLAAPPDDWGGRAIVAWAEQLAVDAGFDPEAARLVDVHRVLDRIYGGPA